MKLLQCLSCYDVFNLTYEVKECRCGETRGKYLPDGVVAVYSGYALPLGINNLSLHQAHLNQPEEGSGVRFDAFVVPKECPTFREVDYVYE